MDSNREVLLLSDQLTEEVLSSDLLVIASPMGVFGLPWRLTLWVRVREVGRRSDR